MHDVYLALELTLYGLLTVFGVLLLFLAVIALLKRVFPYRAPAEGPAENPVSAPLQTELVNVDEPTAAMILAIVSEKTGIPPEQLRVKTIRRLGENEK